jgi:hypothetical protein
MSCCVFYFLFPADDTISDSKFRHEHSEDIDGGFFGFGEEDPHLSGRTINNDEMSRVAIVGHYNLVRRFIWP